MAELHPFNALRYTEKAGNIKDLVCPPYDIISEEERLELLAKNKYNAINLELCKYGEDIYATAGKNLNSWLEEGILKCDDKAGLYIYEEEFKAHGRAYKIKGLISLIRLEEFDKGVVLPHEETLSHAKEDRLKLMNATGCNFSSIYLMYHDKDNSVFGNIEWLSAGEPDQSFVTEDGIKHNLWFIYDEDEIEKITDGFADKQLYIADGHHRYTTMLNYRNELKEKGIVTDDNHPANFGMMTMMNIENPGLVVFPTHRVVKGMENFNAEKFLTGCDEYFEVKEVEPNKAEEAINQLRQRGKTAFALYYDNQAWTLTLTNNSIMNELLPNQSDAYKKLDVTILHTLLLERLLGIDKENLANQKNLIYTRSAKEAYDLVDSEQANCAFLINSTGVDEIAAVADVGEKMPQKSTYFYPKLITGHVMNKIMDIK